MFSLFNPLYVGSKSQKSHLPDLPLIFLLYGSYGGSSSMYHISSKILRSVKIVSQ